MNITEYQEKPEYIEARKKVKKIKGFYIHFIVYIAVNLMIVVINIQDLKEGESYFQARNFLTAFFWGIGILIHGVSVFVPNFLFSKTWEQRKIQEILDKENEKNR